MLAWVNREFLARRAREAGLFLTYHALPYNRALKHRARSLRKGMTPAERKLWYGILRTRQPRFLRQRPIDHYIVDFYCSEAGIVVEVDGGHHQTEEVKAYDARRTGILEGYGLIVLRFTNAEVLRSFDAVAAQICAAVQRRA